jgi:putative PIN family toxin of toxin-antitoxin system
MPLPRAVVDTSVLIALLWGHGAVLSRLLALWRGRRFRVVTSPQMIAELRAVAARPKMQGHVLPAEVDALIGELTQEAIVVAGTLELPGATRDLKDDKVIACAVEGDADYLVTLDPDMLSQAVYKGIHIIGPVEFVQVMSGLTT